MKNSGSRNLRNISLPKMVKDTLTSEIATPLIAKLMNKIEENSSTFSSTEKVLGLFQEKVFLKYDMVEKENAPKIKLKKPKIDQKGLRLTSGNKNSS